MYRLALDSCTKACSVALIDLENKNAEPIYWFEILRQGHAELQAAKLEDLMKAHNIQPSQIDHLCVTIGPGTFTGARIALAFARMFAKSLDLPIIPMNSLQAIAYNAFGQNKNISVAIDARRDQVYFARFDQDGNCLFEAKAINIDDAKTEISEDDILLGTGAFLLDEKLSNQMNDEIHFPNAAIFGKFAKSEDATKENVSPLYLRAADAKLPQSHPITFT